MKLSLVSWGTVRAVLLHLILFVAPTVLFAEDGFAEAIPMNSIASSSGAATLRLADLDGDGDKDLVVGSVANGNLLVHENLGGSFAPQQLLKALDLSIYEIVALDLEMDGDLDLVVSGFGGLYTLENLGGFNFSSPVTIVGGFESIYGIRAFDYNGDGLEDLIFGATSFGIGWAENLGAGAFGSPQLFDTFLADYFDFGDFDMDGDEDMIALDGGVIRYYQNLGPSNFAAPVFIFNDFGTSLSNIAVEDFNNDGKLDFAFIENSSLLIREGDGMGGFPTIKTVSSSLNGIRGFAASDVDLNGDMDIVVSSFDDDYVGWFRNFGGTFSVFLSNITTNALQAFELLAEDIDGDGYDDVIATAQGSDLVSLFINQQDATFSAPTFITRGFGQPTVLKTADLDGDGDQDFVIGDSGRKLVVVENLSGGNLGIPNIIQLTNEPARNIELVDLNGDGNLDILRDDFSSNSIGFLLGTGTMAFSGYLEISGLPVNPIHLIPIDFDNDGDFDIASISNSDNRLAIYENIGFGFFGAQQVIGTTLAKDLEAIDVSGNGFDDLVYAQSNGIFWRENLGGGSFGPEQNVSSTLGTFVNLSSGDINGDGYTDIVASGGFGVREFRNNGTGGLLPPQPILTDPTTRMLDPIDIDGDGDLDIVASSPIDGPIYLSQNDGTGNFVITRTIENEISGLMGQLFAFDDDGDGDLEVGYAINSTDSVPLMLMENLLDGPCDAVASASLTTSFDFTTGLSLAWSPVDGVIDYQVKAKLKRGTRPERTKYFQVVGDTSLHLMLPFQPGDVIRWSVRHLCSVEPSEWPTFQSILIPDMAKLVEPIEGTIFPNPTTSHINLSTHSDEAFQITICNAVGKTLYHETGLSGQINRQIDASTFGKGLFFIRFEAGKNSWQQTFIVE